MGRAHTLAGEPPRKRRCSVGDQQHAPAAGHRGPVARSVSQRAPQEEKAGERIPREDGPGKGCGDGVDFHLQRGIEHQGNEPGHFSIAIADCFSIRFFSLALR